MEIEYGILDEIRVFTPKVYNDDRGFFLEYFNDIIQNELKVNFVQDNHSKSKKNVIRGLHYQWENPMGKLVRVVKGKIRDIAVDLRVNSPTYGQWQQFLLTEDNFKIAWIPPGFAHGFISLEDDTHVCYGTSALYNSSSEGAISPLDPDLNIDWGAPHKNLILSDKDRNAQSFVQYKKSPKF